MLRPFTNRNDRGLPFQTGKGRSIAQHGELFQGQIEDEANQRHRCLLSLPCEALYSEAILVPDLTTVLRVDPEHKHKAKRVVELTFEYLNTAVRGGMLRIESTVPEAKGYGSSTADCVAAAQAAAHAFNQCLSQEELARLVVHAEVASDNFMFQRAVLFAHREGVVLEDYARNLPSLEVIGIDTATESHVDTLEYPPAIYSWRQLQSFKTLTSALRRAIRQSDVRLLGRVATASASINEIFLPKPMFKEIRRIADAIGALGVSVAHSGTILSVLLDIKDSKREQKIDQLQRYLSQLKISEILRFQT